MYKDYKINKIINDGVKLYVVARFYEGEYKKVTYGKEEVEEYVRIYPRLYEKNYRLPIGTNIIEYLNKELDIINGKERSVIPEQKTKII